jgi:predicted outer membrane repeat protein
MGINGGEKVKMINRKNLGFFLFCMVFTLTICGAASATSTNTTHDNLTTSISINTTNDNLQQANTNQIRLNSTQNTQTNYTNNSINKLPDPQIYKNGAPVAVPGYPAGHVFPTIAAAISAAQPGDTIMLESGQTFNEHGLIITKNLNFSVFKNGIATINGQDQGPVFIIYSGTKVVMQNLIIENGSENGDGGGIENSGNLTLNDCVVKSNFANFAGGIVSWGPLTLNGCNFTDNTAYIDGGAICCSNTLIVKDSAFSNNIAKEGGAGAIWNDGKSNITGSTFTSNTAKENGGGAICNYETTLAVNGCNFTSNNATGRGGAIYNDEGTLNVRGSIFTSNNVTTDGGGAIYSDYGALNVTGSTFTNNNANYGGGAIYNIISTLIVNDCTFTSNSAPSYYGGAICNCDGNLTVNHSTFTSNSATSGGGAIYNDNNLTIINSTFKSNNANYGLGGAICNYGTAKVNFNRIIGNTAANGNAIYNDHGSVNAQYNWWGSNANPSNNIYGNVTVAPWLVLTVNASTTITNANGTSTITADLLHDSKGVYHNPASGDVANGIKVNFTSTLGTIGSQSSTVNGSALSNFKAGSVSGVANVSVKVDNQTVNKSITIDTIPPKVKNINPANNAINIPINQVITVTFSEPIKTGSAYANIILKNSSGTVIPITKSISGNVLTIIHSTLLSKGTKYTLTIPVSSVKDLAGNNLASAYTNSFTVTPITVQSIDPVNKSINVTANKVIKVTFSELIFPGSAYSSITVKNSNGVVKPMTASISGNVLTLTPTYNYVKGMTYTINIPINAVKDSAGNGLNTAYISKFTVTTA